MTQHHVLVPLDGSDLAEQAISVAKYLLGHHKNGKLTLARALETPRLSAWLPAEMLTLHQREQEMVERYLEKLKTELDGSGFEVEGVATPGPGPVEDVVELCGEKGVELVVMTSHGQTGWVRYFLGSNTEKLMRVCPAPVLVVKNPDFEGGKYEGPKKIMIPLDGSERAQSAIPQALDIAPGGTARILLVGVSVVFQGHAFEGDMRTVVKPDLDRVRGYLDEQAEWLRNQGYLVDVVVRRGDAAGQILELAKEEDVDLIMMTSQGQTGFAAWLYGSVAEKIVRGSDCSVLVFKEDRGSVGGEG